MANTTASNSFCAPAAGRAHSATMRILVLDPSLSGHRAFYLRLLLPALLELSPDVTLVTGRGARESPEFHAHLEEIAERVHLECVLPSLDGSLIRQGSTKLRGLMEAIADHRPEHVFVPSADHLTQIMGAKSQFRRARYPEGVEMEALMMRGGFAYPFRGMKQWVQDRLSLLAIERAPWTVLHYVDPIPYELLRRRGGPIARRVRLLPDPVDSPKPMDREAARRRLGVPEDGRYVGSVGMIDTRRGIDRLIWAFAKAPLDLEDRLLLAGPSSAEVRSLLTGPMAELVRRNRIIAIDRYFDNEEFVAAVSALDVVCAAHPHQIGSVSIVIRAAAAERPVLTSTFGWVGMVVPRLGLGWSCDVLDTDAFALEIAAALERSPRFRLSQAARRFVRYHSVDNFQAAWTARLRARLGLTPAAGRLSWKWVLEGS
jgi:glycosyltransferase involved in cell wall biosynthesis